MNETATCANSDKKLTNIRSLDVLAGWQPIETAPKDGSDIILLSKNGIRVAHWQFRSAVVFTGWYIALDASPCSGGMFAKDPTHWMPLPAPPVQP